MMSRINAVLLFALALATAGEAQNSLRNLGVVPTMEFQEILSPVTCVADVSDVDGEAFWNCPQATANCNNGWVLSSSGHQTSIRGSNPELFGFQLANRGTEVVIIEERKLPGGFTTPPTGINIRAIIKEDPALIPSGGTYQFTAIAQCFRLV